MLGHLLFQASLTQSKPLTAGQKHQMAVDLLKVKGFFFAIYYIVTDGCFFYFKWSKAAVVHLPYAILSSLTLHVVFC